jgi:hypothetical protein
MVKIIDYGRAFYKDNEVKGVSSTDVLKTVCTIDECNERGEDCGNRSGFRYLTNMMGPDTYFISSSEVNPSADLRFLYLVRKAFQEHGVSAGSGDCGPVDLELEAFDPIDQLMDRIFYGNGLHSRQTKYGTKPVKTSGLPDYIENVEDAEELLRDMLITSSALRAFNEIAYEHMEKICDIHIYADGVTNMRIRMA